MLNMGSASEQSSPIVQVIWRRAADCRRSNIVEANVTPRVRDDLMTVSMIGVMNVVTFGLPSWPFRSAGRAGRVLRLKAAYHRSRSAPPKPFPAIRQKRFPPDVSGQAAARHAEGWWAYRRTASLPSHGGHGLSLRARAVCAYRRIVGIPRQFSHHIVRRSAAPAIENVHDLPLAAAQFGV